MIYVHSEAPGAELQFNNTVLYHIFINLLTTSLLLTIISHIKSVTGPWLSLSFLIKLWYRAMIFVYGLF